MDREKRTEYREGREIYDLPHLKYSDNYCREEYIFIFYVESLMKLVSPLF
jgi:hypothetical protein